MQRKRRGGRLRRAVAVVALVALLVLSPLTGWVASGAGDEPAAQAEPQRVRVGVYLLSVDRFDLSTKSYTLDFYLTLRCDAPCDPGGFEFLNGRPTASELYAETPTERTYRVLATFSEDLDLRAFPFDEHSLDIAMESKTLTADRLVYVVDEAATRIDPAVRVLGWRIQPNWTGEVTDRHYPGREATFSRYSFAVYLKRPVLAAVIRSLLPAIFIMVVAFVSLILSARELSQRLTAATSALLAAMLFHLSLASALPHLDYLTLADRFMIINYATLVAIIVLTVAMILVTDMGRRSEAPRLRWGIAAGTPAVWLLLQVASALLV